jgi:hypothetical protein
MDPYIERPSRWTGVHHRFLGCMSDLLAPILRPAYFVQIEERVYLMDESDPAWPVIIPDLAIVPSEEYLAYSPPVSELSATALVSRPVAAVVPLDDEIHEARLSILDIDSNKIVTVIELLSPTNKVPGSEGMHSFAEKRKDVLHSDAHWIEIDLLRGGARIPIDGNFADSDYRVHLSRVQERPQSWVWPIALQHRLPKIPIPLRPEHPEAELDLQAVLNLAYDRAGYDLILKYTGDPNPPFTEAQRAWAKTILKAK